jgi:hypothetical protein
MLFGIQIHYGKLLHLVAADCAHFETEQATNRDEHESDDLGTDQEENDDISLSSYHSEEENTVDESTASAVATNSEAGLSLVDKYLNKLAGPQTSEGMTF